MISLNLPQPWPDLSNTVVCLYFRSVFLIGKHVTGNASRARAELGLVLNTCLDINIYIIQKGGFKIADGSSYFFSNRWRHHYNTSMFKDF